MKKIGLIVTIIMVSILMSGCFFINHDNEVEKIPNHPVREEKTVMKCEITNAHGHEECYFTFNGGKLVEYKINLTVPDGANVDDYYISEQIANSGRYEISLEGNVITSYINPTRPYWDSSEFAFKDMTEHEIKKYFSEIDYVCKWD